jgi:hypothetical protein
LWIFGFGLTSSFAVSFEVVFFLVCFIQQLLQYPAKEYPDYLLLFALPQLLLVQIGWVLSVERCQTQTPSFQSLWQFHFQEGI